MSITLRHISAPSVLSRDRGDRRSGLGRATEVPPRQIVDDLEMTVPCTTDLAEAASCAEATNDSIHPALLQNSFLRRLMQPDLSALLKQGQWVSFQREEIVSQETRPSQGVLFILRGTAKAEMCARIVKAFKLVVSCLGPGDDIGLFSVLDGEPDLATVTATAELHALSVPVSPIKTWLGAHPQHYLTLAEMAGRRLRATELRLRAMI